MGVRSKGFEEGQASFREGCRKVPHVTTKGGGKRPSVGVRNPPGWAGALENRPRTTELGFWGLGKEENVEVGERPGSACAMEVEGLPWWI